MTGDVEIVRWARGKAPERASDRVTVEEPLAIRVDGKVVQVTMRTPGHDAELAAGFLASEGIVRTSEGLRIDVTETNRADATLPPGASVDAARLARYGFASSSCGLCGTTVIERIGLPHGKAAAGPAFTAGVLLALPEKLRAGQTAFAATGGLHAAAAFTPAGELLCVREDVGRHNAVDKVVGWGLLQRRPPFTGHGLLVSGRVSFEILQKALAGGFPLVAAVSAPSSLAVAFAERSGQTLVGFLRDGRFNVYAHADRVK